MLVRFSSFLTVLAIAVVGVRRSSTVTNESEFIINSVNSNPNSTWKASGDNVIPGGYGTPFGRLMGTLPRNGNSHLHIAPVKGFTEEFVDEGANGALPEFFDSRQRWPKCLSLLDSIKDQSNCASCWAVSAASVLSDRLCIASSGAVTKNLSAEHLNTCCYRCGHGCDGGYPESAWIFFARHGIVTGGDYNSEEGCQPYSIVPCGKGKGACVDPDPDTPECAVTSCTNAKYTKDYRADLYYVDIAYSLPNSEKAIMADIYKYGPVQAAYFVYTDFMYYTSGVYQYTRGEMEGGHAIKILGWGVENGVKYWLCANSWGRSWGENGMFRIIRGRNECHMEDRVQAGLAHVPKKKK